MVSSTICLTAFIILNESEMHLFFFNETDFSITETNLCLRRHTPSILMDRILQSASLPFYLKEQVKLPGFI